LERCRRAGTKRNNLSREKLCTIIGHDSAVPTYPRRDDQQLWANAIKAFAGRPARQARRHVG
jgi:hypothetical protein